MQQLSGLMETPETDMDVPKQTEDSLSFSPEHFNSFTKWSAHITPRKYQTDFASRIIRSLIRNDGNRMFALWARGSGKTETVVDTIFFASIALPSIYNIRRFKKDFVIGLFAPIRKQAIGNIHYRLRERMAGFENSIPGKYYDFKADTNNVENMSLSNGVRIMSLSASKEAHNEGMHCHLIVTDETQDIPDIRLKKSIFGMGVAKNATRVMIGSATPEHQGYFYEQVSMAHHRERSIINAVQATEFMGCSDRSNYLSYLEKMKKELGEDSIEYRTQYMCEWVSSKNTLITLDKLIKFANGKTILEEPVETCYAGIDAAKTDASTVVTITNHVGSIMNWMEIRDDDYMLQGDQIKEFLLHYNLGKTLVDKTSGAGEALTDILQSKGVNAEGIHIGSKIKDRMYKLVQKKLRNPDFSYPGEESTERFKFERQMTELVMRYKAGLLTPSHKTERNAHDDYPDSFGLSLLAMDMDEGDYMEVGRIT